MSRSSRGDVRQPVGRARGGRARPRPRSRRPGRRSPSCSGPRPAEVVFTARRHRGRQPRGEGRGPRRPCRRPRRRRRHHRLRAQGRARVVRPPRSARGSGSRGSRSAATGVVDLDALADALDDRTVRRVGDARQQRGRHRPAARRDRRRWCASGRRGRVAAHRRGAGGAVARRRPRPRPAPTSWRSRRTSSAGRRASARSSCATASALEPLIEGGGQERGLRSGTSNVAGAVGDGGRAAGHATTRATPTVARIARAARPARRRPARRGPRLVRERRPPAGRSPGNAHVGFRGRRGRDAAGRCSTTPACARPRARRARRARPSRRTCSRRWASPATTRSSSIRLSLGYASTDADVDVALAVDPARGRAAARRGRSRMSAPRVLVAMSGGVDSSVAAALLARAGPRRHRRHAQALGRRVRLRVLQRRPTSRTPGGSPPSSASRTTSSTSPTTSTPRVVEPVRRRATRRAHAEPVRRVQPVDQVRAAARARRRARVRLPSPPATTRGSADGRDGAYRARARGRPAPRTSRTCSTCSASASSPARCSRSASSPRRRCARTRRRLGLRTAAKPESMDVCFITRGGRERVPRRARRRRGRVRSSTPPARCVGAHDGVAAFTIGQRRGARCRRRRAALRRRRRRATRHRHARVARRPAARPRRAARPHVRRRRHPRPRRLVARRCARTASRSPATLDGDDGALRARRSRGSRPDRWSRSTTATRSSAAGSP